MENNNTNSFRQKIHEIIFEADTTSGKLFDIILLTAILLSIVGVMLESVYEIDRKYHELIIAFEWGFTILFTIEYFFRIYAVNRPFKYIFSFMGIVDLLAIIPTYLIFILPAAHSLSVIRAIRLIRIFRIFKLSRYLRGAHTMQIALRSSRPKIIVFLLSVILLVNSIYWAIITLTTVGYGNIVPMTIFGKIVASFIMILGYGIIAVPTGIVTAEFSRKRKEKVNTQVCPDCTAEGHDINAEFCNKCGAKL